MSQIMPLGDRILVKRRKIGDKIGTAGLILAADETKERPTDLADVVHMPEHSFADKSLIENSEDIINALTLKAKDGESEALISLLRMNEFLKIKSIQKGQTVMISKYVGTDFHDNSGQDLTLVNASDVIGVVHE